MKNKIKYIILLIFMGAVAFSCQDDNEYDLKEYNPKGGFAQKDFTIESKEYLKSTKEDVKLALDFNRFKSKIDVPLEVSDIEPSNYSSAFTLTTSTVTMSQNRDTVVVGQIDWSKLECDSSMYVTLKIAESETVETGTNTGSLTIKFHKEAAPTISLGNTTYDLYFNLGSDENLNTNIQIEALDKPAEEEIRIPLQNYFELQEGTQFDINQELYIPVGSKTASINVKAYNSAFAFNERAGVWLEIHKEDVPDGLSVKLSDSYWVGANLGKTGEIIKLLNNKVYSAKINPAFDTEPTKSVELKVDVSDFPVLTDLEIPVKLNQTNAKEGTHFLMPEKILKIKAGDTTGIIKFDLLPENFSLGETVRLWVELDTDYDAGENVVYDNTDWWTAVDLTKLDAYTVALDQNVSYDALISDVSTDVDVDVVMPNVLDKAAPSDIEIPVQFNEYNLQMNTHFKSDGIIRVNSGETSGTITITVIGSAFSAGESKDLYIEVHDEDMPTDPVLVSNPNNWWTTIKVGKL